MSETETFPRELLELAHVELCNQVAAEHEKRGKQDPDDLTALTLAARWYGLALRIRNVLDGNYAPFDKKDVALVLDEHMATLRPSPAVALAGRRQLELTRPEILEAAALELEQKKARSRELSALGVLMLRASRGQLSQLRSR